MGTIGFIYIVAKKFFITWIEFLISQSCKIKFMFAMTNSKVKYK